MELGREQTTQDESMVEIVEKYVRWEIPHGMKKQQGKVGFDRCQVISQHVIET